jgi:hypothetical protein
MTTKQHCCKNDVNTNKDDSKTTINKIMIQIKMIIKQHCCKNDA